MIQVGDGGREVGEWVGMAGQEAGFVIQVRGGTEHVCLSVCRRVHGGVSIRNVDETTICGRGEVCCSGCVC